MNTNLMEVFQMGKGLKTIINMDFFAKNSGSIDSAT